MTFSKKKQNDDLQKFVEIQSALLRISDVYGFAQLNSFARHLGVFAFFICLAITTNFNDSLFFSIGIWLLTSFFRGLLWRWGLHNTYLWNWLFFVRVMLIRWIIALLCVGISWLRSPLGINSFWQWILAIFIFDLLFTIFAEGRSYAKAKAIHTSLEIERDRLVEESRKATEEENRRLKAIEDVKSRQRALDVLDKLKDSLLQPFQDYQKRSQSRELERNVLRQKYEEKFGQWENFEKRVKERLYSTLSIPNLPEIVGERAKSDPDSLDSLYYFAAEDIQFNMSVSQIPGAEMAELDTHDQWINHLLQKEYEQLIDKENVQASDETANTLDTSLQRDNVVKAIEDIARLRQKGILTEEEFQLKKAELLKRL